MPWFLVRYMRSIGGERHRTVVFVGNHRGQQRLARQLAARKNGFTCGGIAQWHRHNGGELSACPTIHHGGDVGALGRPHKDHIFAQLACAKLHVARVGSEGPNFASTSISWNFSSVSSPAIISSIQGLPETPRLLLSRWPVPRRRCPNSTPGSPAGSSPAGPQVQPQ